LEDALEDREGLKSTDIRVRDVPRRSFLETALYLVGAVGLLGACGETSTSDTGDQDGDPVDLDPTDSIDTDGDPVDSD